MRIATPLLFLSLSVAAQPVFADPEVSFSFGVMQHTEESVPGIVIAGPFPAAGVLDSDDFSEHGDSFEATLLDGDAWIRFGFYHEESDQSLIDGSGIGFNVEPNGIGLFNATIRAEIERENTLARVDFSQQVANYAGIDLYAGGTIARIRDNMMLFADAPGFLGTTNTVNFNGNSDYLGPVFSARYSVPTGGSLGPFSLDAFGSLALLYGQHDMQYRASGTGDLDTVQESSSDTNYGWTGAAELGVTASYGFSEFGRITATYQIAHYADAISTPAAILATDRSGNTSTSAETGALTYHGFSLGVLFEF